MKAHPTRLSEVVVIESSVHEDHRGLFHESYSRRDLAAAAAIDVDFVQDNQSWSRRHVLRGLHYQLTPLAQGKLVRPVTGSIFDVAVDVRRSSPTFGQWVGVTLTAGDGRQVWVPPGFAHGFVVLSDGADVLYKATEYYAPDHDRSVRWDDPDIGIEWPLEAEPILSEKDASAPFLRDADVFD